MKNSETVLELIFLADGLREEIPHGVRPGQFHEIEQTYLLNNERVRKLVTTTDEKEVVTYEVNHKEIINQTLEGVRSLQSEYEMTARNYARVLEENLDPKYAVIHKKRGTFHIDGSFLKIHYYHFTEEWVLDGAMFLVDVTYDEGVSRLEDIAILVASIFINPRNVSADSKYQNMNIARRIAERRAGLQQGS